MTVTVSTDTTAITWALRADVKIIPVVAIRFNPFPACCEQAAEVVKLNKEEMTMKLKQKELKERIGMAIKRFEESLLVLEGNDNPQVIAIYNRYKGSRETAQNILDAINGNHIALNIMAGK